MRIVDLVIEVKVNVVIEVVGSGDGIENKKTVVLNVIEAHYCKKHSGVVLEVEKEELINCTNVIIIVTVINIL